MKIFVDIDNTICTTNETNYEESLPIQERIDKINKLYDEGNTIVYWTARGTLSNKNWFGLTYNQLNKWGCKFNELRMGKPYYDLFIDDKNINSDSFFQKGVKEI